MQLGCIADDYTGASDLANTLARSGMATVQYLGIPDKDAAAEGDAAVVSLKIRSVPAIEAVSQALEALAWLRANGARQILYKICSTFDSTPEGNIGPVAEALAEALGAHGVAVCPAFPGTGRTIYRGHLFVGDRLLSQSGLEHHPLNPMTDPDIRRWLRKQTRADVGLVAHSVVASGADAVRRALDAGPVLSIVDALDDGDLLALGKACSDAPLVVGGSAIGAGLASNFTSSTAASTFVPQTGRAAIISGSCSQATLIQIANYRQRGTAIEISPDAVLSGAMKPPDAVTAALAERNGVPLLFTSADAATVEATQAKHGRERVSEAMEAFAAETARLLVERGVTRLVVAGGETSGAVVRALGIAAFSIGPEIAPGVPALSTRSGKPLAMALKSGNFGGPDFFAHALDVLAGRQ